MDYLRIFNPLETGRFHSLTGGWRGFKNEAGRPVGSHQMSKVARNAYDEARKKGDAESMRKIAEEQHKIRKDRAIGKVLGSTVKRLDDIKIPSSQPRGKVEHREQVRELQKVLGRIQADVHGPGRIVPIGDDTQRLLASAQEGTIRLLDRSERGKKDYSRTFEAVKDMAARVAKTVYG